jgi:5-methylthioribose kinase
MLNENPVKTYFDQQKLSNIERLNGGLVNYVYRLSFGEDNQTLIRKYYSPYLASNPSISNSQQRYFTEKNALNEFSTQNWLKLNSQSRVRTPEIYHFDDENFVIIMQDAGLKSRTLFELLRLELNSDSDDESEFFKWLREEMKFFVDFLTRKSNVKIETHRKIFENKPVQSGLKSYLKSVRLEQAKSMG